MAYKYVSQGEVKMARIYKTARGKGIDIDKLKLANEHVVAVGNMKTNARGDLLGAGNKVAQTRNQIMDQVYAVEEAPYSPNDTKNFIQQRAKIEAATSKQLNDLVNNSVVPTVTTTETTPEGVTTTAPAPRGSLASSVAKKTEVTQEPLPDPRKPANKGPSRI